MRITKELASTVSKKMVEKKRKEIQTLSNELSTIVEKGLFSLVPEEVKAFYEKYPKFTKTTSSIKLLGKGFNHEYFSLNKRIPNIDDSGYSYYEPTEKEAVEWIKLKNKISDLQNETDSLQRDIENTINNLKTYKQCEDNFPDAFKHFPKSKPSVALALNIPDLVERLKK